MRLPKSWIAGVVAVVYALAATYVTQDEVRHSHGGWINLRGFGTVLITAPSQIVVAPVLKAVGVPEIDYARLGFIDYGQLAAHILVSAAIVYLVVAGLHQVAVRLARAVRRGQSR